MHFAVTLLITHVLALTNGRIIVVTTEGAAGGVVLSLLHLALHILGRGELQHALCGKAYYLLHAFMVVEIFALWLVDHGEGAKALDGHTAVAFGEDVAYLVEDMGKQGLDGGTGDAATLNDGGGETLKVFVGKHF